MSIKNLQHPNLYNMFSTPATEQPVSDMSASGLFCGDITAFVAMPWFCNDFRNDVKVCACPLYGTIAEAAKLSQIQFRTQVCSRLGLSLRAG